MSRKRILLIVETSLSYGREVLKGINSYVVTHEPWSLFLEQRELMVEHPAWLESWDGDGVISRSTTPALAKIINRKKIPLVDLTDVYGKTCFPFVGIDHEQTGEFAAKHLLERGFRNFAFCGFTDHLWSLKRFKGFERTVNEAGYKTDFYESPWKISDAESWDQQQEKVGQWLNQISRPSGIMACNDMRGQHILDACRRQGISVPEEIAVIGVDNDDLLCNFCDPPLSSVILNPERVGYEASRLLEKLMNGIRPESEELNFSPVGIQTRLSTDVLAIEDPVIASAVQFIRQNACEGITVDDVLKKFSVSRSILERRFRQFLKRSPQAEIRNVQLRRIKQLLSETDLSLEQISILAGYEHSEYMSVVFKRELKITPGQFRKQSRSQF